jgi:hypothetical protein
MTNNGRGHTLAMARGSSHAAKLKEFNHDNHHSIHTDDSCRRPLSGILAGPRSRASSCG